ncbi:MAG: Peroxiredoxin, partial [Bacteroidetes bacterium]|nr:Peroxiredoxin [Bacteroidota bacterium]
PSLQKTYTEKGVVWLSICSSAPGNEGYWEGDELRSQMERMKSTPSAYLVDADGTVGRLYAAKTTPTMYIVDPGGILIYAGGIDDTPSTAVDAAPKARNYVREALDLAMAGKPVEVTYSRAYGCSVKY